MMNEYSIIVKNIIDKITSCEKDNILAAAKVIYDSMTKDGILQVFATGHSHMVAEELFYRAGGLVQVNPILEPFLMQHEGAIKSTKMERLSGIADNIYGSLNLSEQDPFLIVSNSGINAVPVEMAEIARKNGHYVICITSMETTKNNVSRTKSEKKLFEVSDLVIDNHVPYGDGAIEKDYGRVGAVSSIACAYIVQSIVLEIINLYEKNNLVPPVYQSANIPGGDAHNQKLYEKYKSRIKCLY